MPRPFEIKKIAVLGAGVMGAQIAAHCVNAGFRTLLFDLASSEPDHNSLVDKAIQQLSQMKPSPLGNSNTAGKIQACNYDDHLPALTECDLIIEAIGERMDWKEALYRRITSFIKPEGILASNTSGLSINALAHVLPEPQRLRFCGIHFFNPPRYMHLAELIPAETTDPALLDFLETWLTRFLGKGVVRANDTPNFIANRIGVFSLLATLRHAQHFGLGCDEVDALTGTLLGRPKSATFRTMDVVGLDTLQHVVETMKSQLSNDPWHAYFQLPEWLMTLIKQNTLGQKTGQGIYRKKGKSIEVFDAEIGEYRTANKGACEEVVRIFKSAKPNEIWGKLQTVNHPQAQFLVVCFRDLFYYNAFHLKEIAHTVRDVDNAMRWGFGWQQGPFEIWQMMGLANIRDAIRERQPMVEKPPLPNWVEQILAFYEDSKAYSAVSQTFETHSALPVYQRQRLPHTAKSQSQVIYENDGVRMVSLEERVSMVYFKTKANTIGQSVLDGLNHAIDHAEALHSGLIIYQYDPINFSSGADLRQVFGLIQAHQLQPLEIMVETIQNLALRLKYCSIPTVAAIRGRALGGGCELMLQCDAIVAAFESYPGLVEVGVGLIPAGAGTRTFSKRAAMKAQGHDLLSYVQPYFQQIATATVSTSAIDALQRGFLKRSDDWVMHADEVLFAAVSRIKCLMDLNYVPPLPTHFPVAGIEGRARLQAGLVNWLEGEFISKHDYFIGNQLAHVICGGDVNEGQLVDDAWMLKLEKQAFMTLADTAETQARILAILETGKPLRN